MSKLRFFRREDGEVCVYPPFVAYADGYDIVVWSDWTERDMERTEKLARTAADHKWSKTHDGEHSDVRHEQAEYVPLDVARLIRVKFIKAA